MTLDELDQTIAGLGALDDAVAEIVRDADDNWIVRVGDIDVVLQFDAAAKRLRIGAEIGVPPQEDLAAIYETLLVFNAAASLTGDVVMSLSGPGGSVMQHISIPATGLTGPALIIPIVNIANKTVTWRELIVQGVNVAEILEASPLDFIIRA